MAITKAWLISGPLLAGLAGGCVGVKPHDSFPAVSQDVSERIGYSVQWHDGSPKDQQADEKIAALLAQPLTADSAVQIALLNNRRLQATYEDLGVAQADLVGAGMLRNPIFDAAYRFGDSGAKARIDFGLTFDFVGILFTGVRKKLAAAELETTKARVTATVLDLAGEVRSAFYEVQAAEQAVALREQIAQAAGASTSFAKRLREAGNVPQIRLLTEQAAQAQAQLDLTRAQAEAAAARERLNSLLGAWGDQTKWTVTGKLADPSSDEPDAKEVEQQAIARSLDLRIGRAEIVSELQTLGVAQPLGVLSQMETGIHAERDGDNWFTGPTLALPLPIFSQGQPAAAKALAKVRQGQANLYATAVETRSAARAALARVLLLRQQVDATRGTLLPLRQSILDQSMLQYNAMQVGAFDLLAAKRDQIDTQSAYLTLLRDYWQAKSDLELIRSGRNRSKQ